MNNETINNSTINMDANETDNLIDQLNNDLGPRDRTGQEDSTDPEQSNGQGKKQHTQVIHFQMDPPCQLCQEHYFFSGVNRNLVAGPDNKCN